MHTLLTQNSTNQKCNFAKTYLPRLNLKEKYPQEGLEGHGHDPKQGSMNSNGGP